MTVSAKREQLMIYLADVPDKKVKELYDLLEKDITSPAFSLSNEHLQILEKRRNARLSGEAKGLPWREVHAQITAKKK